MATLTNWKQKSTIYKKKKEDLLQYALEFELDEETTEEVQPPDQRTKQLMTIIEKLVNWLLFLKLNQNHDQIQM